MSDQSRGPPMTAVRLLRGVAAAIMAIAGCTFVAGVVPLAAVLLMFLFGVSWGRIYGEDFGPPPLGPRGRRR